MNVKLMDLPKPSRLVQDYTTARSPIATFFDYLYNDPASFSNRHQELQQRSFKRDELVEVLREFNQNLSAPTEVLANINRLGDPDAVTVVGGQQAGLLTGPIYTIHKCLAILHLAKEQEEKLKVPVIPVFWIAGEDHDYAEVNHVYAYKNHRLQKMPFRIKGSGHISVTDLTFNPEDLSRWVEEVFQAFGETEYTEQLLQSVKEAVKDSTTLVTFFGRLIHQLFGKYGLVLMDSGDARLRQLEATYFSEMIDHAKDIAKGVTDQLTKLQEAGYPVNLDQTEQSANLFLTQADQRILLSQDKDVFMNEDKGVQVTKHELLDMAENTPELLSNNVVTRPLMQDLVLPTLAFIAGPGEIAYWSALKPAFHELGILMPPVVPRFHLTLVDRQAEKWLEEKQVSLEEALQGHLQKKKEAWLAQQHTWEVDRHLEAVRQAMSQAYTPYQELASNIHDDLKAISQSNWDRIDHQLTYLKKQMDRHIRLNYESELRRFDALEAKLLPNQGPQERSWSTYAFLNQYGLDLVDRLMNGTYLYNGRQYVVYL